MKEALRSAGVPCAKYKYVNNLQEAWSFIDLVGFPIILNPLQVLDVKYHTE